VHFVDLSLGHQTSPSTYKPMNNVNSNKPPSNMGALDSMFSSQLNTMNTTGSSGGATRMGGMQNMGGNIGGGKL